MPSSETHLSSACQIVEAFNQALNLGDLEEMARLLTSDTVFENTYPAPDGTRYEGLKQVCTFWEDFFRNSNQAHFEIEELFGSDDRTVMRWRYAWENPGGGSDHIRGMDVYRVRDGRIAEKLSYVKG